MNDTIRTLLNRRSIRIYKQNQIKDEELQLILEAGKFAPSGMNTQPWHFTVVQKKEMLLKINDICRKIYLKSGNKRMEERAKSETFSVFYNAPTLIIVSGDEKAALSQPDCILALGNMLNAAASLDIGSCWINAIISLLDTEDGKPLRKDLGIPEGYKIFASAAFGYKAESPVPSPRKEGIINIVK